MSTEDQSTDGVHETDAENPEDVAQGVTNQPRGNGDLDEDARDAGTDKLGQAGGGH